MKKSILWSTIGALCGLFGFFCSLMEGREAQKEHDAQLEDDKRQIDDAITASFNRVQKELESI